MEKKSILEDLEEMLDLTEEDPIEKEMVMRSMVLRHINEALNLLEKGEPAWRVSHPLNRLKKKLL